MIQRGEAVWSTAAGFRLHIARDESRTFCGRWVFESAQCPVTHADCSRCVKAWERSRV